MMGSHQSCRFHGWVLGFTVVAVVGAGGGGVRKTEGLLQYPKVPKVTTLVTFGFRTLLLSLLSEARYYRGVVTFRLVKMCAPHRHFKK